MLLTAGGSAAQDGPVRLANLTEPSSQAQAWRNGLELALREINARGGILGRQVVLGHVEAAVAARPYVLLAARAPSSEPAIPVLSPERLAGDPARAGGHLADFLADSMQVKAVALIVARAPADPAFRDGVLRQLAARHIAIAAEIGSEPQQVDFSAAVLRAKTARADALVALVGDSEAQHLVTELRRQRYGKPVVGGAALAGASALGEGLTVRAAVGLSPAAPAPPIRDMVRKYEHAYGVGPDAVALAGYSALYMVKAITERAGKVDAEAFARAMAVAQLSVAEHPGVLLDFRFDDIGNGHRGTLLVEGRDGRLAVVDALPP